MCVIWVVPLYSLLKILYSSPVKAVRLEEYFRMFVIYVFFFLFLYQFVMILFFYFFVFLIFFVLFFYIYHPWYHLFFYLPSIIYHLSSDYPHLCIIHYLSVCVFWGEDVKAMILPTVLSPYLSKILASKELYSFSHRNIDLTCFKSLRKYYSPSPSGQNRS